MCVERGSATDAKWEVERPQSIVDRLERGDIFVLLIERSEHRQKRNVRLLSISISKRIGIKAGR